MDLTPFRAPRGTPPTIARPPATARVTRVDAEGPWVVPIGPDSDQTIPIGPCRGGAGLAVDDLCLLVWTQERPWAYGLAVGPHTHDAGDINAGVLALARLPVAASGESSSTKVVRADDSRLSNARTPTAHSHSDLLGRNLFGSPGATSPWFRVGTINGIDNNNGGTVTLVVAGQGNIGQTGRVLGFIQVGQRGANTIVGNAWLLGSVTGWSWYTKQISTYVYEIWARRPTYDVAQLSVLHSQRYTHQIDSSTTTDPGGLVAFGNVVTLVAGSDPRLARAAGSQSFTLAAESTKTIAIDFPPGLFAAAPRVAATAAHSAFVVSRSAVTVDGCSLTVRHINDATASLTFTVDWIAVQE